MKYRPFGKTGINVSEIALGTWQLGSVWGQPFNEQVALETLEAARLTGVNCLDTADVYQGGQSERTIGVYNKGLKKPLFVITKIGRRLPKQTKEGYTKENVFAYIDDSRKNLDVDALDMVLLHCPPTDVYYMPEVFKYLDEAKALGKIKHYGVSVERIEEGLKALDYPGVAAIEIIFNMFRLRPSEHFFKRAQQNNVGIIVRVPLASGLLTGKFKEDSTFNERDHRHFNREGAFFDKGETFSGVEYSKGLEAVKALKAHFTDQPLALVALRFILMFDAVSTVIPGASSQEQMLQNAKAAALPPLSKADMDAIYEIYDTYIKDPVHYLW